MRAVALRAALLALILVACRDSASARLPATALGRVASDWLAAHNRDEGHAVVHFTLENRGTGPISGAQVDSIVYAGVRLADSIGHLLPVQIVESSDSTLAVLLRSANGGLWTAHFTPAAQPSLVKVAVTVDRTWIVHGGSDLRDSGSAPR